MLIMSTNPLTASAASESGSERESPKTTMLAPKAATTTSSVRPAWPRSGRRASMTPGHERADGRGAAQDAEPDRPGVQDRAREHAAASATAPPKSTAKRSSVIAPSSTCVRRMKRMPGEHALEPGRLARSASTRRHAQRERRRRGRRASSPVAAAVDELRREREEEAAERGPDDDRDLEGDRAERHRARDQLERDEHRRAARAPAGCRSRSRPGRRGEQRGTARAASRPRG